MHSHTLRGFELMISKKQKILTPTDRQIKWLQREAAQLVTYSKKIDESLEAAAGVIKNICSFICKIMEQGESFRVNFVRFQNVSVASGDSAQSFLFLIDQRGDSFPPPFPALNCEKEGFFNDDPQAPYLFPPKRTHIVWFAENIAQIVHNLSDKTMYKSWEWDKFVGKFFDNLLAQNPIMNRILDNAKTLSRKRWIKNENLINYMRTNWEHIDTNNFQEFHNEGVTGHILHNEGTWALVIEMHGGAPGSEYWRITNRKVTFGASKEEMVDKMYEVFF